MLRRFGPLVWASGLGLVLGRLRLDAASSESIRAAAAQGPIVYVFAEHSLLDWLALNRVLNAARLPVAQVTPGLRSRWLRPLREVLAAPRVGLEDRSAFAAALARGRPTALALRGPQGESDAADALLDLVLQAPSPPRLIPVNVLWRRLQPVTGREVARFLWANQDPPQRLEKLVSLLTRDGEGLVIAGQAVDLDEVRERLEGQPPARQRRILRLLLRRYLYRAQGMVRGPRVRRQSQMRRMVLGSKEVRALVHDEAHAAGRAEVEQRARVRRVFERLTGMPRPAWVSTLAFAMSLRFGGAMRRQGSGRIAVSPDALATLRTTWADSTPVLVTRADKPEHLAALAWALLRHDLAPPRAVIEEPIRKWLVRECLRRMGAVLAAPSRRNKRVQAVLVRRLLLQLIRDGFPLLLSLGPPVPLPARLPRRYKILSALVDAAGHSRPDVDVRFLPIRLVELEPGGGTLELPRWRLVVGEPRSVRDTRPDLQRTDRESWREAMLQCSESLDAALDLLVPATPASALAAALLSRPRTQAEALARAARLAELLGQPKPGPALVEAAIHESLVSPGEPLAFPPGARGRLWARSASARAHLAPAALVALAHRAATRLDEVEPRLVEALATLRGAIVVDPHQPLAALRHDGEQALIRAGVLAPDTLAVVDPERLSLLAGLVEPPLEALAVALRASQVTALTGPTQAVVARWRSWGRAQVPPAPEESTHTALLTASFAVLRDDGVLEPDRAGRGLVRDAIAAAALLAVVTRLLGSAP